MKYKLVPIEPTQEMLDAASVDDWYSSKGTVWRDVYLAMLEAAPQVEQEPPLFKPYESVYRWVALKDGQAIYQYGSDCPKLFAKSCVKLPEKVEDQEPVARVVGYHAGRCVIESINRAAVMTTNMALYTTPQPTPDVQALVDALETVVERFSPVIDDLIFSKRIAINKATKVLAKYKKGNPA